MLQPSVRLNVHRAYRLTIKGRASGRLADTHGNLLDGAGTGRPGSNYVTMVGRHTLVFGLPGTAFIPIVPVSWHVNPAPRRVHPSRSHTRPSLHPARASGPASGKDGGPRVPVGARSGSWSIGGVIESGD
jgi:hypothetical protein